MLIRLYAVLVWLLTPLLVMHLHVRARNGKEDRARLTERYGRTNRPAFDRPPYWLHAASVGEAAAALTLIAMLRELDPTRPVVLTTGTVTSAKFLARALPTDGSVIHQYAPLDHPCWVNRFLDHWAPAASIRVESELWPTTLIALKQRHIPSCLLNAHMSAQSCRNWHRAPATIRTLLDTFDQIITESEESATHFRALGAMRVSTAPNIKFIADPLAADESALATLRTETADRPLWLYASTHANEESLAATVHQHLKTQEPNVLTLIALRHPDRRDAVRRALSPTGLRITFRTDTKTLTPDTDIHVIDTMGELGLFYRLAPCAVIGRSFSTDGGGGHNPIEPALVGCFPLSGPHIQNLKSIYDEMRRAGAVEIIDTPEQLPDAIAAHLHNLPATRANGNHARATVQSFQSSTRQILHDYLAGFTAPHTPDRREAA